MRMGDRVSDRTRCGSLGSVRTALALLTRDLRIADNPVLAAAAGTSAQVIPCYVVDDEVLARYRRHATRLAFLIESLRDTDVALRALGGALVVRRGAWAETVLRLARASNAGQIHVADDYSAFAQRRLARLELAAADRRVDVVRHPGVTLVEPGTVRPAGASAYQVFTPYYRRWQAMSLRDLVPAPDSIRLPDDLDPGRIPEVAELTADHPAAGRPAGGESAGLARLRAWSSNGVVAYDSERDNLASDGVSHLSPYLHMGCLSARTLVAELAGGRGNEAFIRQLAWRDFFHQVLAARPEASWQDYRRRGDQWRQDDSAFAAWQQGRTGYPVVDAAMRQLASEGFMHNRARMITASFLTKDLYIDWRQGAAHFMRLLADGDIACNQLNWQWVAGTGTDASPHRVFNPTLQGRRFDPGGSYVRRYLPELAGLPAEAIHDPDTRTRRQCGYPEPIVDHRAAITEYRARRRAQQAKCS
jgi:deoxyribodipyrimidine photo-lyase